MKYFFFVFITFICFSSEAQQTDYVDFTSVYAELDMRSNNLDLISASVYVYFDILKKTDSIYLDAKNLNITYSSLNKDSIAVFNDGEKLWIKNDFKASKNNKLTLQYKANPKKAIYFVDKEDSYQVWTQGQGKYTSNWLPSIDDVNDKIKFDLTIAVDSGYQVIANGKHNGELIEGNKSIWFYKMQKPMSSYLVALAIGKYSKKEITSKSGIPIELYYYPEDSAKVEPTYRYTKQMFDFLEEEIGVPYPWQNYKQVPVKDFLYSGMENTSLTIFSDDFMIDNTSFIDKNYVNVNAHELAHQWFGNLVTATKSKHHWLQEGFATYYALLAERDVFGDDYYYLRLYEYAQELLAQEQAGNATALLDPKASSTTFYKKGAWALHVLQETVGEQVFKQAVKNYLEKHAFKNVETQDFIIEVEKLSGQDLSSFEREWLLSKELPLTKMRSTLKKNESIAFLETIEQVPYLSYRTDATGYVPSSLVRELPKGFYTQRLAVLREALKKPDYPTYRDLIEEAFKANEIKTRQLLAQHIPDGFKEESETLLQDASYITIEHALMNLWSKFPKNRVKYLETTKYVIGFNNKNVRCLWLTLALLTPEYNSELSSNYLKELRDYTASKYSFQTRQNAFMYIKNIQVFNTETLVNLIEATTHHNWRFKSFARDLLKTLSEDEKYKSIIGNLQEQLKNK